MCPIVGEPESRIGDDRLERFNSPLELEEGEVNNVEAKSPCDSLTYINYQDDDTVCSEFEPCKDSSSDIAVKNETDSKCEIGNLVDSIEEDLLSIHSSVDDLLDVNTEEVLGDENVKAKFKVGSPFYEKNKIAFSSPNRIQTLNWSLSSWEDGPRRSAFQPYKPTTVLTNLQRGNIQTRIPQPDPTKVTWFEKAGRGDIVQLDLGLVIDINVEDENGFTALMWAAAYGQTSTVEMLLLKYANVNCKGKNGESALHFATAGGHYDVVRLLVINGADVDGIDCDGNTALIYAVYCDHPRCVNELLVSGASMTMKNLSDQFPYHIAVKYAKDKAKRVLEYHILSLMFQDQRDECVFGFMLDHAPLQNI